MVDDKAKDPCEQAMPDGHKSKENAGKLPGPPHPETHRRGGCPAASNDEENREQLCSLPEITHAQHAKLAQAIAQFDLKSVTERICSRVLAKAELDALQSEVSRLQAQLDKYTALKSGAIRVLRASSLSELPQMLIKARIARGLSQRKLAEKLGMKEQQIQRYESEEYAQASFARLNEVADALGLKMEETAELG
jgi:DNA-binding XRE family transcriptional regulator